MKIDKGKSNGHWKDFLVQVNQGFVRIEEEGTSMFLQRLNHLICYITTLIAQE